MYGSTGSTTRASAQQNRRLLDDSLTVAEETSGMADGVMERLYGQRQALESSNARLGEMRGMTEEARLALKDMERKAVMQKICLYSTIGVLSILILLVAYRELTNGGNLF